MDSIRVNVACASLKQKFTVETSSFATLKALEYGIEAQLTGRHSPPYEV
jgi:hypothetical protein